MSYLKALLKISLILFFLLAGGIAFYTYNYGDDIKGYLLKEINQQLAVKANVKEVEISLWKDFPSLSLILKEVKMHSDDKVIISANELRVKFSLADLIDKNFSLHEVDIREGELNLLEGKDGKFFPEIWKKEKGETEESNLSFQLDLQKISLWKFAIHYEEKDGSTAFDLLIKSAWAKGNFGMDAYNLSWNSDITQFSYLKNGVPNISEEDFKLEAICRILQKEKKLTIAELQLDWRNLSVSGKGKLDYENKLFIHLDFNQESSPLKDFYPLLSQQQKNNLDSLSAQGNMNLGGKLSGELSPEFRPKLSVTYTIENASFQDQKEKWQIRQLALHGNFETPNLSKAEQGLIKIDSLQAYVNNLQIGGKMYWNLNPSSSIHFVGKTEGKISDLQMLVGDQFELKEGRFSAQADLALPKNELKESFVKAWKKGDNSIYFRIENAGIDVADASISKLSAEAALGSNDLYAKSLSLRLNEIEIEFDGKLLNLISFMEDSTEALLVDGKAKSPDFNVKDFLSISFSSEEEKSSRPYQVQYYIDCQLDQMEYEELLLSNLRFYLQYRSDLLDISNYKLSGMEGAASGDFSIRFVGEEKIVQTETDYNSINIHELFKANKNFGQEMIKSDNLYGKASGFMNLQCKLDEKNEIIPSSLVLNGFIDIHEGRLVNYEPLFELSNYIELEELKEIRFKRLQNQIRIANEEIYIPRFQIRSSALDLEMEGTHQFNNQVDYRFSLLLDQIIGKKAKKPKENEFGYIEDDGLGKTQLFLRMTGNISDPNIRYDNQQLGKHLKKEVKEEKTEIKAILKEEFGLFKKDTTLKSPAETQNEAAPFVIEWNEDPAKVEEKSIKSKPEEEKKSKKKGKFGKFIDKIAKPNEEEYVSPRD